MLIDIGSSIYKKCARAIREMSVVSLNDSISEVIHKSINAIIR